jgi:hypothetical protein
MGSEPRSSEPFEAGSKRRVRLLSLAVMLLLSNVAIACAGSSANPHCAESLARGHLRAAKGSAAVMRDVAKRLSNADTKAERRILSQKLSREVKKVEQLTNGACD